MPESARRPVAASLIAAAVVAFALLALAIWGVPGLSSLWAPLALIAAGVSLALLVAFWDTRLLFGVAIDVALVALVLVLQPSRSWPGTTPAVRLTRSPTRVPAPMEIADSPNRSPGGKEYDLAGLDGREIVDRLDRTPVAARQSDLRASVHPGELRLSEVGSDESTVERHRRDDEGRARAIHGQQRHLHRAG